MSRQPRTAACLLALVGCLAACDQGVQGAITVTDLATEIEHVADLLGSDRDCEALQAIRAVDALLGAADLDTSTAEAIGTHVLLLRDAVTCDPGQPGSPSPQPPEEGNDTVENRGPDRQGPPPGRGRGRGD